MSKRKRCVNCGYVPAPIDPPGQCVQCVQRARLSMGVPTVPTPMGGSSLEQLLLYLHDRADGWFRVVSAEGSDGYFKWKFTSGQHAGSYILYVVPKLADTLSGYWGLVLKLGEVDRGELKPSPDRPY